MSIGWRSLNEHVEIRDRTSRSLRSRERNKCGQDGMAEHKAYGSMMVLLTKSSDARRLLREGFFHVAGESGYTGVFERRPRPEQCFNCQEPGHKVFQCKNAQKCARCGKEGHHHNKCTEIVMKCVPCGGPNESFSRNCQRLYPSQHE